MSTYPYRMLIGCPAADCGAVNATITTFWPEGDSEDPTFLPNASADGSEPATWAVVSTPATEAMVAGMRELREEVSPELWIYVLDAETRKLEAHYGGAAIDIEGPVTLEDALISNGLQKIIIETEELI